MLKFLFALLLSASPAFAQTAITLPIAANAIADLGNGPTKVRMIAGNASIFTSQGSGVGSTSGSSTTLTLTATPATPPIVGGLISGSGITSGTTIAAFNGTTGITLSAAMTVVGGTAVSWGAACPSSVGSAPAIQASVQADYFIMYTQARVCAVSPGGPVNTLLIEPVFFEQPAFTTVNGVICTLGQSCTVGAASSAVIVGTTLLSGGTTGRLVYDNAGIVGELPTTGSGSVALATAPTVSNLTVTGALTATGLVTNTDLVNSSTTVNSQTCTLGSTCTVPAVTSVATGTGLTGGPITTTGTVSLANTAVTPASYGSSTSIPSFTVDQQGRLTTAADNAVIAPAGTLTGATLASNVLASSLTSVGTIAGLTVIGSLTATGLITNADLANASTTVNGQICTLGSTCTVTAAATAITVGTTTIGSGTTGRILYDNAGVLGELTPTGSGNVVLATAPTVSSLTVTSAFTATGLVTNADLANPATTVNSQTCTLGSTCTVPAVTSVTCNGGLTGGAITNTGTCAADIATNTNFWAGTVSKVVDAHVAQTALAVTSLAISTATFTADLSLGLNFSVTLVHASCPCTMANPTNVWAGASGFIELIQSSTGSDTITTWGGNWKFPGGVKPTLSTAANAKDIVPYFCDATNFCMVGAIQLAFQ